MGIAWKTAAEKAEELLNNQKTTIRRLRDDKISEVAWMRERHKDELEQSLETSLSAEQYTALLTYIQALREVPQQEGFPEVTWPTEPDFLSAE